MPIYEYVCMSCESHFEELVRDDETPRLPRLRVDEGEAAVLGVRGSRPQQAAQLRRPAGGGGGGCCGGSCGCGGH